MEQARYQAELSVLSRRLSPNLYRFCDMCTSRPYVLMAARTNSGKVYTLRVELSGFPTCIPKVFVTKMLKTKDGNNMSGVSGAMHTLQSENGMTRICHYGQSSWTPNVSIYKIYVKCRLWLEMYEAHLRTGHEIQYYLNHQA